MSAQHKKPNKNDKKMMDNESVVSPVEEKDVKAKIAEAAVEIKSNTIEEQPAPIPKIEFRNVITAPPNCPPGQKPDENVGDIVTAKQMNGFDCVFFNSKALFIKMVHSYVWWKEQHSRPIY